MITATVTVTSLAGIQLAHRELPVDTPLPDVLTFCANLSADYAREHGTVNVEVMVDGWERPARWQVQRREGR